MSDIEDRRTDGGGYTSDYEQVKPKAGSPPEAKHVPEGSADSTRSDKLMTDPASGLSDGDAPAPNQGPRVAEDRGDAAEN